jgi:3-phenylpropionate/cinnamic acid dioxygenase small subunit
MRWEDKVEIENLIFRYARLVDTADYDALGAMFAQGEITSNKGAERRDGADALAGAAAVERFYATTNKTYPDGSAKTHHVVTNLEFEDMDGGDEVRVRSCFTVFQATPALALQPIVCGRYGDVFTRTEHGWRYRSKHIEVTLIGELRQHLNIAL